MRPTKLSEWNLRVIRDLLNDHAFEQTWFDWKSVLPSKMDDPEEAAKERDRLRKACASFANTDGGFFVYGVRDKGKSADDRLFGHDPGDELVHDFGEFPRSCHPPVDFNALNPPISLPNGKVIHVIYIPKSWAPPHAVKCKGECWYFPKRTDKGCEAMSMHDIRYALVNRAEVIQRLKALEWSLTTNYGVWSSQSKMANEDPPRINWSGSMLRQMEQFLAVPLFSELIPMTLIGTILEKGMMIDNLMNAYRLAPNPAELIETVRSHMRTLLKELETAILDANGRIHTALLRLD